MSKKKFNQTKVGVFLSKAAPGILDLAGDVLPDAGVLGLVKNLIHKDPVLPADCLLYTSPSPRDRTRSRMPSSA